MNNKVLVVVDMQNDFITGSLGIEQAKEIVGSAAEYIKSEKAAGTHVIFTMDTHYDDYLETKEGKMLPVVHCKDGTNGWELHPLIKETSSGCPRIIKYTFGSTYLPDAICEFDGESLDEIELIGLCTDVCVISNAMILKAFFPNVDIVVNSKYCAGSSIKGHYTALDAMEACQIIIK